MKINEKFLTLFANSPEHVDKEGYLYKKGELNKGFQVRWFVLKGNLFFYFEKQNDKQPIGLIILDECTVEACEGEGCSFTISFHSEKGSARNYILSAKDEREMESWMKVLTISSYSYTFMLVSELERTLNNLRAEENALGGMSSLTLSPEKVVNRPRSDDGSRNVTSTSSDLQSNNPSITSQSARSMDLLTPASTVKTTQKIRNSLPAFKRSKSHENMHKLDKKIDTRSPLTKRKQKHQQNTLLSSQSTSTKFISTVIPSDGSLLEINHVYETGPSTFEDLHDVYGGTIWTRVREFENKSDSSEITVS